LNLALDLKNPDGKISGTLSVPGMATDSTLLADRAVYNARTNPAPKAGHYTLFTKMTSDFAGVQGYPQGTGVGTVDVDGSGVVKFNATMADGTKVMQSAGISVNGAWPCYVPLYNYGGFVLGWVTFETIDQQSDATATIDWFKPNVFIGNYYLVYGFKTQCDMVLSKYHTAAGVRVLDFANTSNNAVFTAEEGGLETLPQPRSLTLDTSNRVTPPLGDKFRMSIDLRSGLFSGSFPDPTTGTTLTFQGAMIQQQQMGTGWFKGNGATGSVSFEALSP
jgi:hypothetical protein